MNNDELTLLTTYISVWGWHILSMIFLCSSFICYVAEPRFASRVFVVTFFLLSISCEYVSLMRKGRIYNGENS